MCKINFKELDECACKLASKGSLKMGAKRAG